MKSCFVMQPFDRDKFDKRYHDIFGPAIRAAGLQPYRVDQDPKVEIPITEIERGIRDSEVCFAEITTDNPNVWFELGYAMAAGRPVCLVCSNERVSPFPFDVRHRKILTYGVGSTSDFQKLGSQITERLQAILEREATEKTIESLQSTTETAGLTPHEVSALAIIVAGSEHESVTFEDLKQTMHRGGFTEIAAGLAARSLKRKKYIEATLLENDYNGQAYTVYRPTEDGIDWMLRNQDQLALRVTKPAPSGFDEIPF